MWFPHSVHALWEVPQPSKSALTLDHPSCVQVQLTDELHFV